MRAAWLSSSALEHRRSLSYRSSADERRDGPIPIVFNGEIYNYRELRHQLARSGVVFRSTSDTEVLLEAYAQWGPSCLSRLRGMFAFVIWDAEERTPIRGARCVRHQTPVSRGLRNPGMAGSQVKSLVRLGGKLTRSAAAQAAFFMWGYVPEPFTPFEESGQYPQGITSHGRPMTRLRLAPRSGSTWGEKRPAATRRTTIEV